MGWLVSGSGALLVVAVLRDVFHTLWHPSGQGGMARWVFRVVWRLTRRVSTGVAMLSGPLAVLVVIVCWALLVIAGWALVYLPWIDSGFSYSVGLRPRLRSDLLDAGYVSAVTMATLGFGDVVPQSGWLRLAVPAQAFVGFGLLTAAVTWVLQIYPALVRRRAWALRVLHLDQADPAHGWLHDDSSASAGVLHELAASVATLRADLTQYSETYYFRDAQDIGSLSAALDVATALARQARGAGRADTRFAGAGLGSALDDLADRLAETFLPVEGSTAEVFAAFAADHAPSRG